MLARLDVETRAFHVSTDGVWRELTGRAATPATYMHQLVRVYGFEAPLEAALAYTPGIAAVLDVRGRVRSGLIARDLLALGISAANIAELPQCMIAPFASAGEALGWMYVLERAALLHDPVRRHLIARFPQLADATAYLAAGTDARWNEFADALEPYVSTRALQQQVLGGARDAFRCALDWFGGREALPRRRSLTG
ncbi:MAG TPA: biliverdin-producing heme oxygenase [Kofleriaceae bacterium]|nr:biliverdin-producing heme oxygenase [Kofleriaceae bacterium]